MEKLLEKMGFTQSEIERVAPEIEKFLSCEAELRRIKKEMVTIKVTLILMAGMSALSLIY